MLRRLAHVVVAGRYFCARRRGGKRKEEGGRRRRDAHRRLAHVVVAGRLHPEERREEGGGRRKEEAWHRHALLSLYCVVPTGAGRSFGAGGASRTGRATPCEGCGRLGYGGGAVVPESGTAACASEVAAGPEMGTVFGVAVAGSVIVASMENSEWAL